MPTRPQPPRRPGPLPAAPIERCVEPDAKLEALHRLQDSLFRFHPSIVGPGLILHAPPRVDVHASWALC